MGIISQFTNKFKKLYIQTVFLVHFSFFLILLLPRSTKAQWHLQVSASLQRHKDLRIQKNKK